MKAKEVHYETQNGVVFGNREQSMVDVGIVGAEEFESEDFVMG